MLSFKEFADKVQNTKFSSFDYLEINKIKPLDINRSDRQIVFVGQSPSSNRNIEEKIFEGDLPSDKVFNNFLDSLDMTRDEVYVTNLIKSSVDNVTQLTHEELNNYVELFYEEMSIIKPLLIVFMSNYSSHQIDLEKLRCPVIRLNHPSFYYRQCGKEVEAAQLMYNDLKKQVVVEDSEIHYPTYINFMSKTIIFQRELDMINFIKNINNMRLVNVDVDGNYKPVISFVSSHKKYLCQFDYYNYCWVECEESECERRSIKGKPCKKLFYDYQKELPHDVEIYEKDIHSDYRFIIDYFDYFKPVQEKELIRMCLDIETEKSVEVVSVPGRIISIVYSINDKNEFLFLNNGKNNFEEFKTMPDVKVYDSEKDMLEYFISKFKECNLITIFNGFGFDLPYLINRSAKLGIKNEKFSPIGRVKNDILKEEDRMDRNKLRVYGIDIIDTMIFCKEKFNIFTLNKAEQMNLDYLGNFFKDKEGNPLGSKVHSTLGPFEQWESKPLELYNYNIQDVVLCRKIEDYMRMNEYLLSFKQLMSTFNIHWSLANSKILDFMMLCHYGKDVVFPSKHDNPQLELPGGLVVDPRSGIYNFVNIMDFSSLYPNILRNFNISYETVYSRESDLPEEARNTGKYIEILDEISKEIYYVDQTKRGLFPRVTDDVMKMKKVYGDALKKGEDPMALTKYNSIKSTINSIYGILSYRYFRLYENNAARCITAIGRALTKHVFEYVDSLEGYKSLYCDTDSVFIYDKNSKTYEESLEKFEKLNVIINNEVSKHIKDKYNLDNHYIVIENETLFSHLLLANAKKSYYGCGYYIKGKLSKELKYYGRGISLVRRDTPSLLRPILKNLLDTIIVAKTDEEIKQAIKKSKKSIMEMDYRNLLITKQMSRELNLYKNIPQHIFAFLMSNKYLNGNFSRARYKGGMLYVEQNPKYENTKVIMLNDDIILPDDLKVDRKKYFELYVENKLCLYLDKFEKFFSKNQTIDAFFSFPVKNGNI